MARLAAPPLAALMAFGLVTGAAAQGGPATGGSFLRPLPGTRVYPESVTYQASTGDYFVGSVADGTLFRGHVGSNDVEVFSPAGADSRDRATGLQADDSRLFVAGRQDGRMLVYDTATGANLANFQDGLGLSETWINDVAIAPDGSAYFTDSAAPILWRVCQCDGETYELQPWLGFDGTPVQYQKAQGADGININGIVATPDGQYLVVAKRNENRLFRISLDSQEVVGVTLPQGAITNPDGMYLAGHTLYVVQNDPPQVDILSMADDYSQGDVLDVVKDPTFKFPTAVARYGDRLLVVDSQFNTRGSPAGVSGNSPPTEPFALSDVPLPAVVASQAQ